VKACLRLPELPNLNLPNLNLPNLIVLNLVINLVINLVVLNRIVILGRSHSGSATLRPMTKLVDSDYSALCQVPPIE